jgi:DNA replication and repair protein RecF
VAGFQPQTGTIAEEINHPRGSAARCELFAFGFRATRHKKSGVLGSLRLVDFRCFGQLALEVPAAGGLFVGANAQGKTSILEAVCVLVRLQSPRTHRLGNLVRIGAGGFGIGGDPWGMQRRIRFSAAATERQVDGDERPSTSSYLADGGLLVWMGNEDLELIRGPGEARRRYLDFLGAQLDLGYRRALGRYQRALRARNQLLKDHRPDPELAAYTELLIEHGTELTRARREMVAALNPLVAAAQASVGGSTEAVALAYHPGGGDDLRRAFEIAHAHERRLRQTVTGPHRDELLLTINGMLASEFASEGQQRTLALSLKLAQGRLLEHARQQTPIYLLDDIFGELDPQRRNALMGFLPAAAQKWITTTHLDWLTETPGLSGIGRFAVAGGAAARTG